MNKQAKLKQDQDVAKDDLTIILSYPHVYRFKPIYYVMIVTVLNYHSSVITIMVKNDNFLCVNCTIKTGTVREQVRNLLKRLLFSSRQAFLLSKTVCKTAWDRVYPPRRPGRGRGADPGLHEAQTGMQRSLSAMLEVLLCLVFASYSAKKVVLYLNDPVLSMVIFAYININIILSAI